MTDPAMWQRFVWRGREVQVIQRWTDPYGRPMLRVADPDDEEMAAGMAVDAFLAEAVPAPDGDAMGLGHGRPDAAG